MIDNYIDKERMYINLDSLRQFQIDQSQKVIERYEEIEATRQAQIEEYRTAIDSLNAEFKSIKALVDKPTALSEQVLKKQKFQRVWNMILGGLPGMAVALIIAN